MNHRTAGAKLGAPGCPWGTWWSRPPLRSTLPLLSFTLALTVPVIPRSPISSPKYPLSYKMWQLHGVLRHYKHGPISDHDVWHINYEGHWSLSCHNNGHACHGTRERVGPTAAVCWVPSHALVLYPLPPLPVSCALSVSVSCHHPPSVTTITVHL